MLLQVAASQNTRAWSKVLLYNKLCLCLSVLALVSLRCGFWPDQCGLDHWACNDWMEEERKTPQQASSDSWENIAWAIIISFCLKQVDTETLMKEGWRTSLSTCTKSVIEDVCTEHLYVYITSKLCAEDIFPCITLKHLIVDKKHHWTNLSHMAVWQAELGPKRRIQRQREWNKGGNFICC